MFTGEGLRSGVQLGGVEWSEVEQGSQQRTGELLRLVSDVSHPPVENTDENNFQ